MNAEFYHYAAKATRHASLILFAIMCGCLAGCSSFQGDAYNGDMAKIQKQLDENPGLISKKNALGNTALACAADGGQKDMVKYLLEKGSDVNATNSTGLTALHFAACGNKTNQADVAILLLDNGADVNAKANGGNTPLHYAASRGNAEVAKLLLDKGADINAKANVNIYKNLTPLHQAVSVGSVSVTELLLDKGADANAIAYMDKSSDIVVPYTGGGLVDIFLTGAMNATIQGATKNTVAISPLWFAVQLKHKEIEALLRQHGATNNWH